MNWMRTIEDTVAGLGYEMVDCERSAHGLLRVFIDRLPGQTYDQPGDFVTVDDCEKVTRQLQYALEVAQADYARLEVSSPGLDRPLKTQAHFERFVGHDVEITLKMPFQGRRKYKGLLSQSVAEGAGDTGDAEASAATSGWQLIFKVGEGKQATDQVLGFDLDEVKEAHLVPVIDFKGRGRQRLAPATEDAAGAAPVPDEARQQARTHEPGEHKQ